MRREATGVKEATGGHHGERTQRQTGATARRREVLWQGGGDNTDRSKRGVDDKEVGTNGRNGEDDEEAKR